MELIYRSIAFNDENIKIFFYFRYFMEFKLFFRCFVNLNKEVDYILLGGFINVYCYLYSYIFIKRINIGSYYF